MSTNKTFCPDCGTHGEGARFCAGCGAALDEPGLAPGTTNGQGAAEALTSTTVLPMTAATMPSAAPTMPAPAAESAPTATTRASLAGVSALVGTAIGSALLVIAGTGLLGYW